MASIDPVAGRAPATNQAFTLYAAAGRIYVRNVDQKIIDLGELATEDGGTFRYLLDGNKQTGTGFSSDEAALHDIAAKVRFVWLDGQFTAVADAREGGDLNLDGATQLDFTLDELAPGERAYDATV
jgi:hypothetical protein